MRGNDRHRHHPRCRHDRRPGTARNWNTVRKLAELSAYSPKDLQWLRLEGGDAFDYPIDYWVAVMGTDVAKGTGSRITFADAAGNIVYVQGGSVVAAAQALIAALNALQEDTDSEGGYLVPRGDGRYVLGATMEERGWDLAPTAGGAATRLPGGRASRRGA